MLKTNRHFSLSRVLLRPDGRLQLFARIQVESHAQFHTQSDLELLTAPKKTASLVPNILPPLSLHHHNQLVPVKTMIHIKFLIW